MRKHRFNRKITTYETAIRPDPYTWAGPILNSLGQGVYAVRTKDGLIKIGHSTRLGDRVKAYGADRKLLAINEMRADLHQQPIAA